MIENNKQEAFRQEASRASKPRASRLCHHRDQRSSRRDWSPESQQDEAAAAAVGDPSEGDDEGDRLTPA